MFKRCAPVTNSSFADFRVLGKVSVESSHSIDKCSSSLIYVTVLLRYSGRVRLYFDPCGATGFVEISVIACAVVNPKDNHHVVILSLKRMMEL